MSPTPRAKRERRDPSVGQHGHVVQTDLFGRRLDRQPPPRLHLEALQYGSPAAAEKRSHARMHFDPEDGKLARSEQMPKTTLDLYEGGFLRDHPTLRPCRRGSELSRSPAVPG